MPNVSLTLANISKSFNRRTIFSDISFTLATGESLTITGRNGSGKSTLLKIVAGILSPTKGSIEVTQEGETIAAVVQHSVLGFVAPYLQLYDEFTALENLHTIQKIRGVPSTSDELRSLLERVGLGNRGNDFLRTYSSGMKQRLKYAVAIAHHPPILLLDEPTSNLDAEGKAMVRDVMRDQQRGGILVVATNEAEEINVCDRLLTLETPELQIARRST